MSPTALAEKTPARSTGIEPTENGIRQWLMQRIGSALKLQASQVDPTVAFDRYGLDSQQAVEVTTALGEGLGLGELPPTLLYDYPTIEQLTVHVAELARAR
jgi:acyl carrier protein